MKKMTEANLRSAFAGESQANMRYLIFSNNAEKEGNPNVARLFRAISYAEQIHATNHYKELGDLTGALETNAMAPYGLGNSSENLQTCIDGETFEIEEMYPVYIAVAEFQGERGARLTFDWALQTEKVHAGMFQKAKQAVDRGEDVKIDAIQICENCGYTIEGDAPDKCPICGVPKDRFRSFK
ncbi:MAG TPA: rubrerythrin family protein [Methanosarcinales archaeon]|nr:rubrerythrin family protein [Methanosarcinales archaeon]